MKKRVLIATLLILASIDSYSQPDESSGMYDSAIVYLSKQREEIKQQWVEFFNHSSKARKYINKRIGDRFEFTVSPMVCFKGVFGFGSDILKDSINIFLSEQEINSPTIYGDKYNFKPYRSEFLRKATDPQKEPENSFYIGFSEPVNNFLIAEIVRDSRRLSECNLRFLSEVINVMFIFKDDGTIRKVYYSKVIVN